MTAEDLKLKPIKEQVEHLLNILDTVEDLAPLMPLLLEFEDVLNAIKQVNIRSSVKYDGEDKIIYKDKNTIKDEVVNLLS